MLVMVLDSIRVQNFYYLMVAWKKMPFFLELIWAHLCTSVHIDHKKKYILILGEGLPQELDDTTLTAEAKYPINFTQSGQRFILSLHYTRSNSFLFVNATKIDQFKAKDSEIKKYPLCLGNISGDF